MRRSSILEVTKLVALAYICPMQEVITQGGISSTINFTRCCKLNSLDSHAFATTASSSGGATGRAPGLNFRMKNEFHESNPPNGKDKSTSNSSSPKVVQAVLHGHLDGSSVFKNARDLSLDKNSHQRRKISCSAKLNFPLRKISNPDGVHTTI